MDDAADYLRATFMKASPTQDANAFAELVTIVRDYGYKHAQYAAWRNVRSPKVREKARRLAAAGRKYRALIKSETEVDQFVDNELLREGHGVIISVLDFSSFSETSLEDLEVTIEALDRQIRSFEAIETDIGSSAPGAPPKTDRDFFLTQLRLWWGAHADTEPVTSNSAFVDFVEAVSSSLHKDLSLGNRDAIRAALKRLK